MKKRNKQARWKNGKYANAKIKKAWSLIKTAAVMYVAYLYFQPALIEMWNYAVPETITLSLWIK